LSPGWAVCDLLSGLTSVALLPAISELNDSESCRQQDPLSGYRIRGHSSPHSASTPAVRTLVPCLFGTSATLSHDRVEPDPPDTFKPPPRSGVGSSITPVPPRPRGPLTSPHDNVFVVTGSEDPQEKLHLDKAYVSNHLSRPYELSPRHCDTPELSCTNSYLAEDLATNFATGAQYKEPISDLSVHLGQLPSPFSTALSDSSGSTYAKIPLFLSSQTPNRVPSPQASSLTHEDQSSSKASPMRSRGNSHNNHPCSDPSHTSALQDVDTGIHLGADEDIFSLLGRSLPTPYLTAPKLPLSLEWPDRLGTNACSQTPSVDQPNRGPSRYQSTDFPDSSEKRRESSGSGCITHEAILSWVSLAQRDLPPSETPVRIQNMGNCPVKVDTWISQATQASEAFYHAGPCRHPRRAVFHAFRTSAYNSNTVSFDHIQF
jgi:hypothetical protein